LRNLIALALAATMIGGCREAGDAPAANDAATNDAGAAESNQAAAPAAQPNAVLGAAVDAERAKTLMHYRHEGMEDIGDAMKVLGREMKGDSPDLAVVRTNAATIARLAPQVSGWFPPGTGPDVGKTHAKPEIWQKPEDFAAKTTALQQAAAAFDAAAQGNDVAAIKASFGELGKACKACHDLYRAKDD
jgi:cytochrome c556